MIKGIAEGWKKHKEAVRESRRVQQLGGWQMLPPEQQWAGRRAVQTAQAGRRGLAILGLGVVLLPELVALAAVAWPRLIPAPFRSGLTIGYLSRRMQSRRQIAWATIREAPPLSPPNLRALSRAVGLSRWPWQSVSSALANHARSLSEDDTYLRSAAHSLTPEQILAALDDRLPICPQDPSEASKALNRWLELPPLPASCEDESAVDWLTLQLQQSVESSPAM